MLPRSAAVVAVACTGAATAVVAWSDGTFDVWTWGRCGGDGAPAVGRKARLSSPARIASSPLRLRASPCDSPALPPPALNRPNRRHCRFSCRFWPSRSSARPRLPQASARLRRQRVRQRQRQRRPAWRCALGRAGTWSCQARSHGPQPPLPPDRTPTRGLRLAIIHPQTTSRARTFAGAALCRAGADAAPQLHAVAAVVDTQYGVVASAGRVGEAVSVAAEQLRPSCAPVLGALRPRTHDRAQSADCRG